MGRRTFLILTGEPSGDQVAARLAAALRQREPEARILAVGGRQLAAAGAEILHDVASLGAMGFGEVLRQLPRLMRLEDRLRRLIAREPPDVVIPVDYPGFNLRVARYARARGVRVVYYVGPQVWAWRARRLPMIQRAVDRMLVIFPFEVEIYRRAGIRADFVGHPLLDTLPEAPRPSEARRALGLSDGAPVLGLLPGSRIQEVRRIFPVMLEAARLLAQEVPDLSVVASAAEGVPPAEYDRFLGRGAPRATQLSRAPAARIIRAADVLLVTSGTATLEAALLGTPLAVLYRTSWLTWWLGRLLVRLPRISLVNIVAGEELVAEFLQGAARPEPIVRHLLELLCEKERREAMGARLAGLGKQLGEEGVAARAAERVLEEIA